MDYKLLAEKYLRYSIWFVETGSAIHVKLTEELRKGIEIEVSQGLSEEEAFNKVNRSIKRVDHPDENDFRRAEEIIEKGKPMGWHLLKSIIEAAPKDDKILAFIGAGPFENWISEENLSSYKKELLESIQNDPKWKSVAESSWHNPPELSVFLEKCSHSNENKAPIQR